MRRPLWALALCLAGLIALWQWLLPRHVARPLVTEGGRVLQEGEKLLAQGYVSRIERYTSYEGEEILLHLTSVAIWGDEEPFGQSPHSDDFNACQFLNKIPDYSYPYSQTERIKGRSLICRISSDAVPKMGSLIVVRGELSYYKEAANPGEWNAREYYELQKIGGSLREAVVVAESARYSRLGEGLHRLREHWRKRLYESYPSREAGIMSAMLLGERSGVDRGTRELYRRGGIIHILSISGLHISILGLGLYKLLRRVGVPLYLSALFSSVLLVLYGMMVGFPVSAIRAIGMYLVYMLGECLHRTYDTMTALGLMALLMLLIHPDNIRNSGFLFSFGSLCGIVLFVPFFREIWEDEDEWRERGWNGGILKQKAGKLGEAVSSGIGIGIFTLPIHLWFYFEAPVYSVWLNLLVLPLMGVMMGSGLLVMIVPGLGWLKLVNVEILKVYDRLCLLLERLPFSMWRPGRPAGWQIGAFYGMLLLAVWFWNRKEPETVKRGNTKRRWMAILWTGACVLILGLRPEKGLSMTFLHVGQGDSLCIQTEAGSGYLVDCGSSGIRNVGGKILIPYLKYSGIHTLKAIVITHPDQDHVNGILELVENREKEKIKIKSLILPDIRREGQNQEKGQTEDGALWELEQRIRQLAPEIPIIYLKKGDKLEEKELVLECVHPGGGSLYESTNAYSLCLLLRYGDFSALLTGDVEGGGEEELVEELQRIKPEKLSLLKVAHHGSRYSTARELLELTKPSVAILSYGEGNSYGHPHAETLQRLEESGAGLWRTPVNGAVRVWTDGRRMKTEGYLK